MSLDIRRLSMVRNSGSTEQKSRLDLFKDAAKIITVAYALFLFGRHLSPYVTRVLNGSEPDLQQIVVWIQFVAGVNNRGVRNHVHSQTHRMTDYEIRKPRRPSDLCPASRSYSCGNRPLPPQAFGPKGRRWFLCCSFCGLYELLIHQAT
jgi:hypothetical protein